MFRTLLLMIVSLISPVPEPEPTPTPPVHAQTVEVCETVRCWLADAGWPDELIPEAMRVVQCESTNRPWVTGDSSRSLGLFQLWYGHFRAGEDWSDPRVNAAVALRVYQREGWRPWTCKP